MDQLGSVQKKISCVFEISVVEEQSNKRSYQPYRVLAVDRLNKNASDDNIRNARATEKIDGTCVYFAEFQGKPWIWARLDRKPNKAMDKKFKKFQHLKQKWILDGKMEPEPVFQWNIQTDFKDVPEHWIPASGVVIEDGQPQPDSNGHIPGWVPIEKQSKQYMWHLSAVDITNEIALILREDDKTEDLVLEVKPFSDLIGRTAELVGTNINANPYGIGNKKSPLHFLVIHGSIAVKDPPDLSLEAMKDWFDTSGHLEGVVWHCTSGALYKVHRHHVNKPWPIREPYLSCRKVNIRVDGSDYDLAGGKSTIQQLSNFSGHSCNSLLEIADLISNISEKG